MLKAILSFAIAIASGSGLLEVREPNKAYMPQNYEVINATDIALNVQSGYYSEYWEVAPNSTQYISFKTEDNVYVVSEVDPTGIGYCYLAVDSEDFTEIEWQRRAANYWDALISAYEPATGIGFYKKKPLPANEDFYYNTANFGTMDPTNEHADYQVLPDGSTARLYKEDGSFTTVTAQNLRLLRYKVNGSSTMAVALAIFLSETQGNKLYSIVAMNFLYGVVNAFSIRENTNQLVEMAEKSINTLSASMFYYSGYTNRVRFTSGYYPFYPNEKGYTELKLLTENNTGYLGFDQNGGQQEETFTALMAGIDLMGSALAVATSFFSFVIFPGITVGVLILIPLLVSLMFFIIKLIKRGG